MINLSDPQKYKTSDFCVISILFNPRAIEPQVLIIKLVSKKRMEPSPNMRLDSDRPVIK